LVFQAYSLPPSPSFPVFLLLIAFLRFTWDPTEAPYWGVVMRIANSGICLSVVLLSSSIIFEPGPANGGPQVQSGPSTNEGQEQCERAATGELRVFSTKPNSVVYIDGARVGSTPKDVCKPLILPNAPVGSHEVVVKNGMLFWQGEAVVRLNKFNSVESDFYSEKTTGVAERAVDSSVGDAGDRIAASLKASELVRQGHTQIRSRKFAEAVKSLQRAVQVDKETPLAYRGLGICYAELRDTERDDLL
jgi:hypothetical protein